jgi:TRAP-type C4-dicarboxylate transport system substrate-binding protein
MNFQMVPVERNDILIALSSNMVEAVFQSPVAVGSTQAFGLAKNMASINVAPFLGGLIFTRRAWRSIPDKYKPEMINAVRRNEKKLDEEIRKLEDDMIKTLGNYGLKVNQLSPQQEQLWYDEIGRAMPGLIGTLFDRNVYGRVEAVLQNYRNGRR